MVGQHSDPGARSAAGALPEPEAPSDEFLLDLTRPSAPVEGQLDYESTVTAPTEWVPYVYTNSEIQALTERRELSVTSLVCGLIGLILAVFGVWGILLSLAALVLSLVARRTERMTGGLWLYGFLTGVIGLVLGAGWIVLIAVIFPGL